MSEFTQIKPEQLKTIGNVVKEEVNGVIRDVRYIPEGLFVLNNPLEQSIITLSTLKEEEYEKPLWGEIQ